MRGLYLELSIIIAAMYQMDYPCQPPLLLNGLIRLYSSSLGLYSRVPGGLLHAFSNQNLQDLKDTVNMF